jgi:hypothetical protein
MKRLKDGDEDDVVGYQPEEYVIVMIAKRATNQSAFRNRLWCMLTSLRWGLSSS